MAKKRRDGEYESYTHGDERFPIGIHKTIFPPNPAVRGSAPYQILYTHSHSEFEFFYLSRGECTVVIDGAEHALSPGDAVFIPPNATHGAYRTTSSQETVFYAVVFSPALLSGNAADAINEKYITPVINGELVIEPVMRRDVPWQSEVLDLLVDIMALYDYTPYDNDPYSGLYPELFLRDDAECAELFIKSSLIMIYYKCILHAERVRAGSRIDRENHDRIRRAIEFIHSHYGEQLTLGDLAASVYMSREYFSHIFRRCTGVSPFAYLNGYRIRRSMELLEVTDMTVTEIASSCGFNQVSYFNRKFSGAAGCTPTEYRRCREKINPPEA